MALRDRILGPKINADLRSQYLTPGKNGAPATFDARGALTYLKNTNSPLLSKANYAKTMQALNTFDPKAEENLENGATSGVTSRFLFAIPDMTAALLARLGGAKGANGQPLSYQELLADQNAGPVSERMPWVDEKEAALNALIRKRGM
jgi:hypothetical protein